VAQATSVRQKLDLRQSITASGFVMILMLAVLGLFALYSIWSINRAWVEGMNRVTELRQLSTASLEAQVSFKVQVQEWKNILLRGDDPSLLAKHHAAFTSEASETQTLLGTVAQQAALLGFSEDASQAETLIADHAALNQSYETVLREMQGAAATLDAASAHAIDVKLRGADRTLEAGIGALAAGIGTQSDTHRETLFAAMAARYATLRWFIISVILGTLAVTGFVLFRLLRATQA